MIWEWLPKRRGRRFGLRGRRGMGGRDRRFIFIGLRRLEGMPIRIGLWGCRMGRGLWVVLLGKDGVVSLLGRFWFELFLSLLFGH